MWGWVKDEPPDAWTLDRLERRRLLEMTGGNVDTSRAVWMAHTREEFAKHLIEQGRISDWPASADDGRGGER